LTALALAVPEISLGASKFKVGLDIAYLCTEFDDCNLSRSGDMVDAHQNFNDSRDLTTPTT